MTYSIIGSGNVGKALARQFARSGISVAIANSRGPETLTDLAQELGDRIVPKTLQDALQADVVILAVPFRNHQAVAAAAPDWTGKIVIDAMNAFGVAPEELKGQASSDAVASALPGAKVVKTLNQLPAKLLATNPVESGRRRVMFISSNHEAASDLVAKLLEAIGFAPIALGKINEGGTMLGVDGPLILQNLIKQG